MNYKTKKLKDSLKNALTNRCSRCIIFTGVVETAVGLTLVLIIVRTSLYKEVLLVGKYEWKGKNLFELITNIATILCAVKAVYDVVRDIIKYKQKSNRPDQG